MNREVRDEWVRRLRSGDYLQARGRLHRPRVAGDRDGYCCLGVLCELAVERDVAERRVAGGLRSYRSVRPTDNFTEWYGGSLPPDVVSWAELPGDDPVVAGQSLSTWNDGGLASGADRPLSFPEIADLIEREL